MFDGWVKWLVIYFVIAYFPVILALILWVGLFAPVSVWRFTFRMFSGNNKEHVSTSIKPPWDIRN